MQIILNALRSILDWFLGTFSALTGWFVGIVQTVWSWVWGLVLSVLNWGLGLLHQLLEWGLGLVGWLIAGVVKLVVGFLSILVGLLPAMPPDPPGWASTAIGAFNVANQILPISEALTLGSAWAGFYGLMALWRIVTFIRGGR